MAKALTLIDGLAVIGGGHLGAPPRSSCPRVVDELNGTIASPTGEAFRRLVRRRSTSKTRRDCEVFSQGETREITVPGSERTVHTIR